MIRVNEGKTHTCTSCVQAMPDPTPIARSSIVHNTRTTYQYAHLDGNVCKPPAYTPPKGTACYEGGDKKGDWFDLSPGNRTAPPSYRRIHSTRSPSGEYTPAASRHCHLYERTHRWSSCYSRWKYGRWGWGRAWPERRMCRFASSYHWLASFTIRISGNGFADAPT